MIRYRPPKKLRALFIIHYSPLLLIILTGPILGFYEFWKIPINQYLSILIGIIIFLLGSIIYFKWELFWHEIYKGQLVTDGIFQYIRHPHYTSLLIIGFGLAFFFYSIFSLIIAFIAIPIMILSIFDEERILIKQYGEDYRDFMKKTPWRIIPRIF
jgi:protein-S-isoprenylcysteine O-methyltransferase Ste14